MTTAFVLSGGASLGAIQVGMAQALDAEGIRPNMVIGTSVGAVNGSWLASGRSPLGLSDLWLSLRSRQIFPVRPFVGLRGFLGRGPNVVPNSGLRELLANHLAFSRLEDAPIPFSVIAAGATDVWVLSTGYSCALPEPPKSALALAMHGLALLLQQRFITETSSRDYPVPVHLIPPPCPITVTPMDFSQSAELMDRARRGTAQWVANGEPYALPLLGHQHRAPS